MLPRTFQITTFLRRRVHVTAPPGFASSIVGTTNLALPLSLPGTHFYATLPPMQCGTLRFPIRLLRFGSTVVTPVTVRHWFDLDWV